MTNLLSEHLKLCDRSRDRICDQAQWYADFTSAPLHTLYATLILLKPGTSCVYSVVAACTDLEVRLIILSFVLLKTLEVRRK